MKAELGELDTASNLLMKEQSSFDDLAQVLPSWKQHSCHCLLQGELRSWNCSYAEQREQVQAALPFLLFRYFSIS